MTITDALALSSVNWMRDHDFDLNKDAGYLALRLDVSEHMAAKIISAGREVEARKHQRGVQTREAEI